MPASREKLRELAEQIGRFHLRAGSMQRTQQKMTRLLASGDEIPQREVSAYIKECRRYFAAFEREARAHLKDVDRRLAHVSQVQFNLAAERGVASRRIEVTQGVLSAVEELVHG